EAATHAGIEVEARSRLGFASTSLEDFYGSVNVAVIRSNVELGDQAAASTSKTRPLQGQSPYVINLQLGYDDAAEEGNGIQTALLYNRFGPRISEVGRFGLPDVYEMPNHRLDAVYSQKIGWGFRVKAKASNLLNPAITFEQADRIVQQVRLGRDVSLELSWAN
ncbi:MAG: TonB-dependent receptor, partial [Deltaproteobacteria bacterium HGW-Deltaproteobacteria-20]